MQHKLEQVKDIMAKQGKKVETLHFIPQLAERENLFYLAASHVLTCKFHFRDGILFLVLSHY